MSECKEKVIEMIDQAVEANNKITFCTCQYKHDVSNYCSHCKINHGLWAARACVIQGADELGLLNVRFIGVQDAIIDKLKAVLKEG